MSVDEALLFPENAHMFTLDKQLDSMRNRFRHIVLRHRLILGRHRGLQDLRVSQFTWLTSLTFIIEIDPLVFTARFDPTVPGLPRSSSAAPLTSPRNVLEYFRHVSDDLFGISRDCHSAKVTELDLTPLGNPLSTVLEVTFARDEPALTHHRCRRQIQRGIFAAHDYVTKRTGQLKAMFSWHRSRQQSTPGSTEDHEWSAKEGEKSFVTKREKQEPPVSQVPGGLSGDTVSGDPRSCPTDKGKRPATDHIEWRDPFKRNDDAVTTTGVPAAEEDAVDDLTATNTHDSANDARQPGLDVPGATLHSAVNDAVSAEELRTRSAVDSIMPEDQGLTVDDRIAIETRAMNQASCTTDTAPEEVARRFSVVPHINENETNEAVAASSTIGNAPSNANEDGVRDVPLTDETCKDGETREPA